jgi:glycosyltransferase involved in cell wall biosynthesis
MRRRTLACFMKISLAYPGVSPFVQQTAQALFDVNMLAEYWTNFSDQPEALWRKLAVQVAHVGGVNLDKELQRRAITGVPLELVRRDPFWEIARSLLSRANVDPRLVDMVWECGIFKFDKRVARAALHNVGGFYGYEYSALKSFQEAQRRGLARIYEVPAPEHDFTEKLIQREIEKFPELHDNSRSYFLKRQERRTERRRQEWVLADIVIANSTFTKRSYAAAGMDVAKVRIVPLGAPPVYEYGASGGGHENEPLRVLWAGTFSIRKGAHYLLKAWRTLAPNEMAKLDIFGAVALPSRLMANLPSSISISPSVGMAALFERYRAADVLVFPTLCDGFGMVVTEAFSQGLPVIMTSQAGAADIIRPAENGLIIPAGDDHAIASALDWCINHRAELKAMRRKALETAARWQWSDFRRELSNSVKSGLYQAGYAP